MCRVGKGRFLAVPTVNVAVGTAKKRPLPTLRFQFSDLRNNVAHITFSPAA